MGLVLKRLPSSEMGGLGEPRQGSSAIGKQGATPYKQFEIDNDVAVTTPTIIILL
jgi:hypothetical protein